MFNCTVEQNESGRQTQSSFEYQDRKSASVSEKLNDCLRATKSQTTETAKETTTTGDQTKAPPTDFREFSLRQSWIQN